RGGASDQQVIKRLGLAACIRAIAGGDQVGGAVEQEIPADAIQRECRAEMPLMASQRGSSMCILD
ncbi:MAG: hypothetical protein ACK5TQ_20920, partial [Acetobacteraceae bacterium]